MQQFTKASCAKHSKHDRECSDCRGAKIQAARERHYQRVSDPEYQRREKAETAERLLQMQRYAERLRAEEWERQNRNG